MLDIRLRSRCRASRPSHRFRAVHWYHYRKVEEACVKTRNFRNEKVPRIVKMRASFEKSLDQVAWIEIAHFHLNEPRSLTSHDSLTDHFTFTFYWVCRWEINGWFDYNVNKLLFRFKVIHTSEIMIISCKIVILSEYSGYHMFWRSLNFLSAKPRHVFSSFFAFLSVFLRDRASRRSINVDSFGDRV